MNVKIERIGDSIQITNSIGDVLLCQNITDVWYSEQSLKRGVIQLYDSNSFRSDVANYNSYFLSEAVNENDVEFTEETFRDFVFNNLGYTSC